MEFVTLFRTHAARGLVLGLSLIILGACASVPPPPLGARLDAGGREVTLEQTAQTSGEQPRPDPKHSPGQVISIVLDALSHNDTPEKDSGIRLTFSFASPSNRAVTGPVERFAELVKNPLYRPLINHREAERGMVRIVEDAAQERVKVFDAQGRPIVYLFTLSKQKEDPYKDCWMTDGVERLTADEPERGRQVAAGNGHFPRGRQT
ncbi:MAG: DUF4864 domain-containing protein [Pyrinomonadaceae bacterium]